MFSEHTIKCVMQADLRWCLSIFYLSTPSCFSNETKKRGPAAGSHLPFTRLSSYSFTHALHPCKPPPLPTPPPPPLSSLLLTSLAMHAPKSGSAISNTKVCVSDVCLLCVWMCMCGVWILSFNIESGGEEFGILLLLFYQALHWGECD